jgi:DNA mismatch repair protein MutS
MNTLTATRNRGSPRRGRAAHAVFRSILYPPQAADAPTLGEEPDYFGDLRLDAVVAAIAAGRGDHNLAPFFWTPLTDLAGVEYRQRVFRDLETRGIRAPFAEFAKAMGHVRACIERARRSRYRWERARWQLDGASLYCRAVERLASGLRTQDPGSQAIRELREFLAEYVASAAFRGLADEAASVKAVLAALRYRLRIKADRIIVGRYRDEPDYGAEVLATFARFQQGEGQEYEFEFAARQDLNHVEAAVVDLVGRLYQDEFAALAAFVERHANFAHPIVTRLDREVQFYLAYLDHMEHLARTGLSFCEPHVAVRSARVFAREAFDPALAASLAGEHQPLVTNDFELRDPERILVVSGPNQGGKTTFARMIGQLHHLAALGVPVPGSAAQLELVDHVFAHFERVEEVEDMAGKLEDDLRRMRDILEHATEHSLLVMNESFSSTTLTDQLAISRRIMATVIGMRALAVVVTFLDELATLGPQTVSMVSQVDPAEPARRTFKILRRPADGLAYAMALADKHALTSDDLKRRLGG